MNYLERLKIGEKDLRLLIELYWKQVVSILADGELGVWTKIKRGVRQG